MTDVNEPVESEPERSGRRPGCDRCGGPGGPARASSRPPLGRQPAADRVKRLGWTIEKLADRLGVDTAHLGAVLRGKLYPSHEVVTRLTAFLGVPVTELFTSEALAHLHEVRPGRPARPLTPDPYDVDDLCLRADRDRRRPPRLPRDLPRLLPPPPELRSTAGSDET